MAIVTVLGAGYMGSALAVVAVGRGHRTRLWGTWLDDALIETVKRGQDHPRLKMRMPGAVEPFSSEGLADALAGAELVINAVTSEGTLPVLTRAWPYIPRGVPILSVCKGFLTDSSGRVARISEVVHAAALAGGRSPLPWVHIGGPSKAVELAREVPTAVFYASDDAAARVRCADLLRTGFYWITPSEDLAGAETCSALKNAYAIASGLCDGLILTGRGQEMYNTKSALFTLAAHEMAALVSLMGGKPDTPYGLPGVGDLLVTAAAGRNRRFGELVGLGTPAAQVAAEMAARDELTEGYPAVRTAWRLAQQLAVGGRARLEQFPLLSALHAIIYEGAAADTIVHALRRAMSVA